MISRGRRGGVKPKRAEQNRVKSDKWEVATKEIVQE